MNAKEVLFSTVPITFDTYESKTISDMDDNKTEALTDLFRALTSQAMQTKSMNCSTIVRATFMTLPQGTTARLLEHFSCDELLAITTLALKTFVAGTLVGYNNAK